MIGPLRTEYDRNSAFMRVLVYDTEQAAKLKVARVRSKVMSDILKTDMDRHTRNIAIV